MVLYGTMLYKIQRPKTERGNQKNSIKWYLLPTHKFQGALVQQDKPRLRKKFQKVLISLKRRSTTKCELNNVGLWKRVPKQAEIVLRTK